MNQDLALRVLGRIMKWPDDRARDEFRWLRLMARLKYDGYHDFHAGMRFVESLVTWLQQFESRQERETAYAFVRHTLVYVGPSEMQRLVEQFYPRTVRDRLVSMVATECGIQRYQVLADPDAQAREKRLRRQTLFMGLSDGAHIDTIRRGYSGVLSNEQFVSSTQVDTEKWKDLLDNLRHDLQDSGARFRLVYLIDDFSGTGTSLLRFDKKRNKWKGKLIRFRDSVKIANEALRNDQLFADDWVLGIHHYVASSAAVDAIREHLSEAVDNSDRVWNRVPETSFGMVFPRDLPIDATPGRHDDFIRLTESYYDPTIRTKHTDVGGVRHLGLGYGRCALPLVLEHNTPNNAIALLWAETEGGKRGDIDAPAMRPLFRRRQRHV